jgi:hypothetical protein
MPQHRGSLRHSRNTALLAAVVYQAGFRIDEFITAVARTLQDDGMFVGGTVQLNAGDAPYSTMALVDLATGQRFGISQELGSQARGCRLDPRGLAIATALLDAAIRDDFDLVVLNKFGKAEAEGGGLRSAFARAVEVGIPVLTAVRSPHTEAWFSFHGGLAADLSPCLNAVLAWCRKAVRESRGERRGVATRLA